MDKSRVKRGKGPKTKMKDWNYRARALPFLMEDFDSRCGYSMRHSIRGGEECLEVDHFNPTLKHSRRNAYTNMILAFRTCNNRKRDNWPTSAQRKAGVRFLNPTKEHDYGSHIFEDWNTGKLVATSPAGYYHIEMLGLNSSTFVSERKNRTELMDLISDPRQWQFKARDPGEILLGLEVLAKMLREMIPPIPPLPKGAETIP